MKHLAVVTVLALAAGANAQIIGGSHLINNGDLNTLAGWLGVGNLQLTNIFDHKAGDGQDSKAFHAAADGKGATITVIRDTNGNIFGGYNPKSWDVFSGYNVSPTDGERTAFLFNITQNFKIDQKQDANSNNYGYYQTYNSSDYGPTWGGGHDIWTYTDLGDSGGTAYTNGFSYGNVYDAQPFGYTPFQTEHMEVFTVAVPAPGAGALLGLGGLLAARRRRN